VPNAVGRRLVVVVAGGGTPSVDVAAPLPTGAPVVAADSGVDTALALGLRIDVVVGDLDSVTPIGLAVAEAAGARIVRHPVAKDATDLALAIEEAVGLLDGPGELVVLGGDGGRLDHLLAGALALADQAWAGVAIRAHLGPATVHVLHGPTERALEAAVGDLLTLVPVGGPASGVRTAGLRFPLAGEVLPPGTTRGVSNVVEALPVRVALAAGTLLAVLPGPDATGDHL
jgi:thiamine pyrophosphokinase